MENTYLGYFAKPRGRDDNNRHTVYMKMGPQLRMEMINQKPPADGAFGDKVNAVPILSHISPTLPSYHQHDQLHWEKHKENLENISDIFKELDYYL